MKRILALAARPLLAVPAAANSVDAAFCKDMALIVYQGNSDAIRSEDFSNGFVRASLALPTEPIVRRVALASYMMGYANGLLDGDPAVAAADFYVGCVSEPA